MSDENNTDENQVHITGGEGDKCDDINPKLKEINTENHENNDDYFKYFIDNYKNYETVESMTGDYKSDSPIGSQKSVLSDKEDIESVINEALKRRQTRFTTEGEISIEKEKKSTGKRRYQIMTICNCSDSETSSDPDPDYDEDSSDSNSSPVGSDDEILTGLKNAQKKNNDEKTKTEQKSDCHATKNNEKHQYNIIDLGKFSEPLVKDLTENK